MVVTHRSTLVASPRRCGRGALRRPDVCRPLRGNAGRCACVTIFLALVLLPIIVAHPILGFVILVGLLASRN